MMALRISSLAKVLRALAGRRTLLLEALVWLVLARLALKFLSFRTITWFLKRPAKTLNRAVRRERLHEDVRWAINQVTHLLPGITSCFPRGIAAQAILRRRGVSATLYYGAASLPGRGLKSHVWVQDGVEGVIGHFVAQKYHVLARYSGNRLN